MATFLRIKSNSVAVIQNNTLTENNFSWTVFDIEENSSIQLNHVTFIRNRLMCNLFRIKLNSSAIIQNNTLTENNVSYKVYEIIENSAIRLYYVTFTRNEFMGSLLWMYSNYSAFIQNNTLIENDVFQTVYSIKITSTIQMNHVTFIRNRLMGSLLWMYSDSSAIIKNNTLRENNVLFTVYFIEKNSNIQLINGAFIQNNLMGKLLNMLSSCSAKLINNIMVGNSLGWIIFAHSSSLEIKKIFIKDNMFSHVISAFQCYVRFESMQIPENNITHSMIYVEDCAVGMASTYVDNSDKFLASALKTRCTYLVYRYYLFEMTRTEIIWSSEVPIPARPIIQLSGNNTLSKVKILVNSLFETEILQYSTKDVLLSVNGELRITTNVYNISSLFIGCTKARVKHFTQVGTFHCITCSRGTYSLINEPFNTSSDFQRKNVTLPENSNFTCYDCPAGGNCTASIKTKSNNYGFKIKDHQVSFVPYPSGLCFPGSQCIQINSCNKNRVGTLCGRCIESYMESFLSTDCIPISSCQKFAKFWLIYCTYALILATFLYYMKDLITLIKTASIKFIKTFKPCTKENTNGSEMDIMTDVDQAEEKQVKKPHFTVSGIFTLIVSFHQIKQLIRVDGQYETFHLSHS